MPTTMKLIAKTTLGSAAATISFTGIPGTYTDLMIVASFRSARATELDDIYMRLNGVVTDRTRRSLYGTGSSAASESASQAYVSTVNAANSTSNTFTSVEIYLPNYAGSTNKSISATSAQEANSSTAYIFLTAGLWSQTAAISSVEFYSNNSQNLATGSSVYLYGITKA